MNLRRLAGVSCGGSTLSAIAKNGVELKIRARVTVRTNLAQLIGGATEETIIARVGEGIITSIGSSESHLIVMENPDRISKAVLDAQCQAMLQTLFEMENPQPLRLVTQAKIANGQQQVNNGVATPPETSVPCRQVFR